VLVVEQVQKQYMMLEEEMRSIVGGKRQGLKITMGTQTNLL
jgi:hypothetical protein